MKTKITGRDVTFFLLGLIIMFTIEIVLDWDNCKEAFYRGYNEVRISDTEE